VTLVRRLIVREALPADADTWLHFRERLWPDADPADLRRQVDAFFDSGIATVAVVMLAFDGDEALGFAEVSLRPYVPGASTAPAPFLEGWFVDPSARRSGVGRALVDAVERWIGERGYAELGSDAILENEEAAAAHKALGFREMERVRFFIKDLKHG
jgi:aminoglycoside 6'-N-acetyltransferase I